MAPPGTIYRRLTGRQRTLIGYSQLWMAQHHILLVKSTRFTEKYQHFALSDIQAIVVSSLPDRTPFQVGAAAASLLWAMIFLIVDSRVAKGFFLVTGAAALAIVIADIARGPRCRCYLSTAVSRELLAPVTRASTARAFLDQVRPAIEAAQGTLAASAEMTMAPAIDPPPQIPVEQGYLPEILFGLYLVDAVMILIGSRFPNAPMGGPLMTTLLAEVVILIAAVIRGGRRGSRDPRRIIYVLMLATFLCIGWDAYGIVKGVAGWFQDILEAGQRGRTPPSLPPIALLQGKGAIFGAGWRMAAGAIGLALARFERK
jgi:hypothetical protein